MARKSTSSEAEQVPAAVVFGPDAIAHTASIVGSFLGNHMVSAKEVPGLIQAVHGAVLEISGGKGAVASSTEPKPAVPIKKSVTDEYIICLEDGKKLTMLRRYLMTHFQMTPEQYRKKWDLPHDYPMVAPAYARKRSAFAKELGLGRIPTGRGRKKKET